MPRVPKPADPLNFDVSDADVDEAIAACDGDARATVRALLVAYAMLEHDTSAQMSRGYARRATRVAPKA